MMTGLKNFLLLTGRISRGRYFGVGVGLFLVKFALDWAVARGFDQSWSPLNYLIWPDRRSLLVFQLSEAEREFGLIMLALALPFIWTGVTLTLQRLRDAGLPLGLILLFSVPLVNFLLIFWLCIQPSKPTVEVAVEPTAVPGTKLARRAQAVHKKLGGDNPVAAFIIACVLSVVLTVAFVFISANVLESYGFGAFVAAPFALGWLAAVVYGIPRRRSIGDCLIVSIVSLGLAGVILVAVAIEGVICILMAAPIAAVLAVLGGLVGYVVQMRPWIQDSTPASILGLVLLLPTLMAAETVKAPQPELREVRTEVIVDASPELVWKYVVAFPPLPEPTDPIFRTGIAYPQRAEIYGQGVGAVRHCVFSTGPFVEPIEIWDEPRCLAFQVTEQPAPMEELSPFHIHPPHLHNFLVSRKGRFELEALPDGRTRLAGTTWYTNRMWPADYWGVWSDFLIQRIHRRVLDHVRECAEAETHRKR
jgi:uncharacterized membrane protein YhaH (DUF805 family)